jgi:membrane fusion protein (multidrug efflux system)
MINKGLLLLCIISATVLGTLFYDDVMQWLKSESTNNAYIKSELTHYSARTSGVIEEVRVLDNKLVSSQQIAVVIDSSEIDKQLEEANIGVSAREERIKGLEKRFTLESANLDVFNSEIVLAELDLADSHDEYNRVNALSEKSFVDQQSIQRIERQITKAKERLNQAKLRREAHILLAEAMAHEIKEEKLNLAQLQTNIDMQMLEKQKYLVLIESDGIFANRRVSVGEYVESGARLFSVVSQSDIWIEANFKETQIRDMAVGQAVRIKIDAFPNSNYRGYIESFMPATGAEFSLFPPDRASGNFTKIIQRVPVKIRFSGNKNMHNLIHSGLSVTVSLDATEADTLGNSELTMNYNE